MGESIDRKHNCLTLIRYFAAMNVFWFHAVAHLDVKMPDALNVLMKFVQGVPVFFIISGFLVWMSLSKDSRPIYVWIALGLSILLAVISSFTIGALSRRIKQRVI